ncbi:hypothetical protein C7S18_09755 [Ahniella affigens]|uniref:Regulator SirB n=1 Tax=Ahniella affigens TaxID=2021234 RepID=A0A2P1PZ09_9GAMM|nr:SirB2 family protein [Ahniella affigens]AVQ00066.1 hypothetical protein C7S18_09755 [Ahniella affigens]
MAHYYLWIKFVHVSAISASFALFVLRGILHLLGWPHASHWSIRFLSYTIDTVLLTAALMLITILHQYPLVHAWLTAKVVLLLAYIVLGSFALKRATTQRWRVLAFTGACLCFGMIYSVARAHHWLGWFAPYQ